MRPELQKMLSYCGMANNSGLRTTRVCSNQQCSGPLYTGVRQSVSKKAELLTQTSPANKWLPVKAGKQGGRTGGEKPAPTYATGLISQCSYFFCVPPYFIWSTSIKMVTWNTLSRGREYLHALTAFHVFITELHL